MSAELIAALKNALPYVKAQARLAIDKRAQAIAQECNGALAHAEANSRSIRDFRSTLAAAGILIDANRRGLSDEYRDAADILLSEIAALLKGTIYERPQASMTETGR